MKRTGKNEWRQSARVAAIAALSLVLANCAGTSTAEAYRPAPGTSFVVSVRAGETVSELALRYHVEEEDIVAINNLSERNRLAPGERLYVPAYGMVRTRIASQKIAEIQRPTSGSDKPAVYGPARSTVPAPRPDPRDNLRTDAHENPPPAERSTSASRFDPALSASAKFVWPLSGPLLSSFGQGTNGERNDGINISAANGTPIRAADAGTVSYVGNELKGYGNLLLIRHDNGFVTAYAHAERITVKRGDRVTRGSTVGYAGATGEVDRPQLHFEIRLGTKPVDPMAYLEVQNRVQH